MGQPLIVGICILTQVKSPGDAIHQETELQALHLPTIVALNLSPLDGAVTWPCAIQSLASFPTKAQILGTSHLPSFLFQFVHSHWPQHTSRNLL